jgi:hypothetical protein
MHCDHCSRTALFTPIRVRTRAGRMEISNTKSNASIFGQPRGKGPPDYPFFQNVPDETEVTKRGLKSPLLANMQPENPCKSSRSQSPNREEDVSSFAVPEVMELNLHSISSNLNLDLDPRDQHECSELPSMSARPDADLSRTLSARRLSKDDSRSTRRNSNGSVNPERRLNFKGDENRCKQLRRKNSFHRSTSSTQLIDCRASSLFSIILDVIPWIVVSTWILLTWMTL